jgi:hypothetical protein
VRFLDAAGRADPNSSNNLRTDVAARYAACAIREQDVGGSNPLIPTDGGQALRPFVAVKGRYHAGPTRSE